MKKRLIRLMQEAVSNQVFPGGVLLVSQAGRVIFHEACGLANIYQKQTVSKDTHFDLASLTKPLATTLSIVKLMAQSRLSLEDRLGSLLKRCEGTDKADIRIRHLLHHNSGLSDYRPYYKQLADDDPEKNRDDLLNLIVSEPLVSPIGQKVVYSDLGFMLLRGVVEKIGGRRLDDFVQQELYTPLGLDELFYKGNEKPYSDRQFAATERCSWRNRLIQGAVHDENAYTVGGVDGHAGLFGTARAIHALLSEIMATYSGHPSHGIFSRDILREFLLYGKGMERALGFDRPTAEGSSSGQYFSKNSVGHLGFTGTSFWMDLDRTIVIVLLTNRIHPTRTNDKIQSFRPVLHDAVMETLG